MSGAELVGIAAAAVQFADAGLRVCLALSKLYSNLRDAPQRVRLAAQHLRSTAEAVKSLRTLAASIPAIQSQRILALIQTALEQTNQLERVVTNLSQSSGDGAFRRGWRAIVTIKKEDDIIRRCEILEGLKATLSLRLGEMGIDLVRQQLDTSIEIRDNLEATRLDVTTSSQQLAAASQQLNSLSGTAATMRSTIEDIHSDTNTLRSELTPLPWKVTNLEQTAAETNAMVRDLQTRDTSAKTTLTQILDSRLNPISQDVSNVLAKVEAWHWSNVGIAADLRRVGELMQTPGKRLLDQGTIYRDVGAGPDSLEDTWEPDQPNPYSKSLAHGLQCLRSCDCILRSKFRKATSFAQFIWSHQAQHVPSCRFHRNTWQFPSFRTSVSIRVLRTILELGLVASNRAGGYYISGFLAVTRVVDRRISPAFQLFEQLNDTCSRKCYLPDVPWHLRAFPKMLEFDEDMGQGWERQYYLVWDSLTLEQNLNRVYVELHRLFEEGLASPVDTDCHGVTLLHETVMTAMIIEEMTSTVVENIKAIVGYLLTQGAVKDARAKSSGLGRTKGLLWSSGDESDAMAIVGGLQRQKYLIHPDRNTHLGKYQIKESAFEMDKLLYELGCDISDPRCYGSGTTQGTKFHHASLRRLPGLALATGYGPVAMAVIRRSETELRDLIARGYNPNGGRARSEVRRKGGIASPLILSLDWLPAMEEALRMDMDESINVLLDYDFPLSSGKFHRLVISPGAKMVRLTTMTELIKRLADQRTRLWTHACKTLCESDIAAMKIRPTSNELLDEGAYDLCQVLIGKGIQIPPAIMVSKYAPNSVFRANLFNCRPELAQALYDEGFRSVDALNSSTQEGHAQKYGYRISFDREGRFTLLHWSCRSLNLSMITWCLDRGSRVAIEVDGTMQHASHALAAGIQQNQMPWQFFRSLEDSNPCPRIIELEATHQQKDQCICYCSLDGCSASSILAKGHMHNKYHSWPRKLYCFQNWQSMTPNMSSRLAEGWEQFFRVEVFERLGMAHTCCRYEDEMDRIFTSDEERRELREEDEKSGRVDELYKWMQEYKDGEMAFDGSLEHFWHSWLERLQDPKDEFFINESHREVWEQMERFLRPGQEIPGLNRAYDPESYHRCGCIFDRNYCRCFLGAYSPR